MELLQATAARTASEVADALDELLARQLLRTAAAGATDGGFQLVHALLQQVVYQELTPWRRRLLHGRAGAALRARQPASGAVLAHHFTQAAAWEAAIACWLQAAGQAQQAHAYEIALAQVNSAFALLTHLPAADAVQLTLLRRRLALARTLVQLPEWEADAAALLALAEATGEVDAQLEALEAQMSLTYCNPVSRTWKRPPHARLILPSAATGRSPRRAFGRRWAGTWPTPWDARARGWFICRRPASYAEAAGDPRLLYEILCNLAFALRAEGRCADAGAAARRALALTAFQPKNPIQPEFADALRELAEANAYLGRWEEAWHAAARAAGSVWHPAGPLGLWRRAL